MSEQEREFSDRYYASATEPLAVIKLCTNCSRVIEYPFQKEFCSDTCFVAWMNHLRLMFPTEKPEDLELAKIYASQAVLRLVKDRTIEENMAVCEILTATVVQLTLTILPQKAKKEIEDRLEAKKRRASLVKEEVAEKNSKQVQSAIKERTKQELAKVGIKLSSDGKCKYCQKENVGEFCSDLHKQNYAGALAFVRNMKMDLATAIQMVRDMAGDE